jgi:hypothetical protein
MLGLLGAVRPRWPQLPLGRSRQAGLDILAIFFENLLTQHGPSHTSIGIRHRAHYVEAQLEREMVSGQVAGDRRWSLPSERLVIGPAVTGVDAWPRVAMRRRLPGAV